MPSTKKRVTVYLTDEQYASVRRVHDATGESHASIVSDLVESARPMLDRLAQLAEAIKSAPEEVRATFAGAATQLEAQYGSLLTDADAMWQAMDDVARGVAGPPLVTRGPESDD